MPKLIFLGTTGYHPNDRRQTMCLLLPEWGLMLDAGSGMYRLPKYVETDQLEIFLSHAHLDHIMGLTFFFDIEFQTGLTTRVHGEADKLTAIKEHLFSPLLFPAMPPLTMHELQPGYEFPSGATLRHFPLQHPGGSVGYRLDFENRSLAYVTDTTAKLGADYLEHIRGVDLLVHECYFPDGKEELAEHTGHSCTTAVAEVAREADVGRLMLIHMNPMDESADPIEIDVARKIFPQVEYAEDCMEVQW